MRGASPRGEDQGWQQLRCLGLEEVKPEPHAAWNPRLRPAAETGLHAGRIVSHYIARSPVRLDLKGV